MQFTGYDGAVYGLYPNYFLTASFWNAQYFRPYSDDEFTIIWDGYYNVVAKMNSSTATPADTPPAGTWADNHGGVGVAPIVESPSLSPSAVRAVSDGLQANGLKTKSELGIDLSTFSVGPSVHVLSANPDSPPYDLVEILAADEPVALGLVTEDVGGYTLAAVRPTRAGFRLPKEADAQGRLGAAVKGLHLEWAWSRESASPFFPIWIGHRSDGSTVSLSLDGTHGDGIHAEK